MVASWWGGQLVVVSWWGGQLVVGHDASPKRTGPWWRWWRAAPVAVGTDTAAAAAAAVEP